MSSLPGCRFDITGASGSQGLLTPKSGWRAIVFPRGGYAAADSTGVNITMDSNDAANRFAANNWVQVGLSTANIRQVTLVGAGTVRVNSAVTVSENDRIYLIGNTQPTVSGGSATYITPNTLIRQRDDDAADLYSNSMVTSNADGLVQFFGGPAYFDVLIQDGNQANQGSIIDVACGAVEGISTSQVSLFGATVTINANVGITGSLVLSGTLLVGQTTTVGGALGVTGTFLVGATATMNANAGVTGTLTVGATATLSGGVVVGGTLTMGAGGVIGGLSVTTGIFGVSNQPRAWLLNSANQSSISGSEVALTWDTEQFDVGSLHTGSSASINITNPGFYLFIGQVQWATIVGATGVPSTYTSRIKKNDSSTYIISQRIDIIGSTGSGFVQTLSGMDLAAAGDYYHLTVANTSGTTQTVTCTAFKLNSAFQAAKLF